MVRLLVGVAVPLLVLLLSVPLILGKMPPNGAYGFRTPKTVSSPDVWYPANRVAGWLMLGAMVVAIGFNLALWWAYPAWPLERTVRWMTGSVLVATTSSVVVSLIYIGRL